MFLAERRSFDKIPRKVRKVYPVNKVRFRDYRFAKNLPRTYTKGKIIIKITEWILRSRRFWVVSSFLRRRRRAASHPICFRICLNCASASSAEGLFAGSSSVIALTSGNTKSTFVYFCDTLVRIDASLANPQAAYIQEGLLKLIPDGIDIDLERVVWLVSM